jgi:predicted kinase
VLLISGVPGAGKTTVSEIVARRLPRSALIHGDQIQNLVISGRRHPNEEPPFEADQQLRLRDRNMAALANNFAGGGFLTVIDDVFVYRARLQRFLTFLSARPVFLAMLAPALAVTETRDAARSEKTVFPIWSHLDAVMRTETIGVGFWIDSSNLTAEETADAVLLGVWNNGVIAEG